MINVKYHYDQMSNDEAMSYLIAFEFGQDPETVHETWDLERKIKAYSFLKANKLTKASTLK